MKPFYWKGAAGSFGRRWLAADVRRRRVVRERRTDNKEVRVKEDTASDAAAIAPHTAAKMVLYKDDDIIAINKPAGLAVHGGPRLRTTLSSYLHLWQYEMEEPPHLAHRLDKETSGVLLLTRHADAARKMARLFHDHKIIKKYWGITVNVPQKLQGSVRIPLETRNVATSGPGRHQTHRVVLRNDGLSDSQAGEALPPGIQLAWTDYRVLSVCGQRCSLVEVQPVTGSRHQIRVHLADGLMCPVLGDYKFAGPLLRLSSALRRKLKAMKWIKGHLYLHACELQIPEYHSRGKPLVISCLPPDHFLRTARMLGLRLNIKNATSVYSM